MPRSAEYDLTKLPDTERLFADTKPDLAIHLAARVGGIGYNQSRPADLYLSNLLMGTYVIETARAAGVDKTVILGTICSYPKFTEVPFREEALWDGYPEETNAPYGIAKKALLMMCQSYRQQYGMNAIYLLPVNLYGPGDNFHPQESHVLPAMIRRFHEAKVSGADKVVVWGTGTPLREFMHVDDCADALETNRLSTSQAIDGLRRWQRFLDRHLHAGATYDWQACVGVARRARAGRRTRSRRA